MPGLVWADEMKGIDLGTKALVSGGIAGEQMRRTREDE